jgi:uncharacterized protein YkwD
MERLKHWLMQRHGHQTLRPMLLLQNIVLFFSSIILFFTVYSFSDGLNSEPILFIRFGGLLLCGIILVSFHFAKGVYVGLRHAFQGSTNLIKLVFLLIILGTVITAYQNQNEIREIIEQRNKKMVFDKINPIFLSTGENLKSVVLSSEDASTKKGLIQYIDDAKQSFDETVAKDNLDSAKAGFEYINQLRQQNGSTSISWNDGIYQLALFKLDDMQKRSYWDHKDPSGLCVGSYANQFNLPKNPSSYADNLFQVIGGSPTESEAIESWMDSKGHRYNLLYSDHVSGAVACDYQNCVFIGYTPSGNWVCDTGENGLKYWETH